MSISAALHLQDRAARGGQHPAVVRRPKQVRLQQLNWTCLVAVNTCIGAVRFISRLALRMGPDVRAALFAWRRCEFAAVTKMWCLSQTWRIWTHPACACCSSAEAKFDSKWRPQPHQISWLHIAETF